MSEVQLVLFCMGFQHYSLILAEKVWFLSTAPHLCCQKFEVVSQAGSKVFEYFSHDPPMKQLNKHLQDVPPPLVFLPTSPLLRKRKRAEVFKDQVDTGNSPSLVSSNPTFDNCWLSFHLVNPVTLKFSVSSLPVGSGCSALPCHTCMNYAARMACDRPNTYQHEMTILLYQC